MKLLSGVVSQAKKKKKQKPYVPHLIDFIWDFNATASRMPVLLFLRKTKSQRSRPIFFVTQMPIFHHKHTNMSPFVSLIVVKSLSLVSDQALDACSEQQVPPFLTLFFRKKGEAEFDLICCCFFLLLLFFYFYKMSVEILDTGVLLSDEKMIDFRGQAVSFEGNCIWFSVFPKSNFAAPEWMTFLRIFNLVSFYFPAVSCLNIIKQFSWCLFFFFSPHLSCRVSPELISGAVKEYYLCKLKKRSMKSKIGGKGPQLGCNLWP